MTTEHYTWEYIRYGTYGLVATDGEIVATIQEGAGIWRYKDKEYINQKSAMTAAEKDIEAKLYAPKELP